MTNSWKSKWYAPSLFHLGKLNISLGFRYNLPKNSAIVAEQKHETMYDEVINKVRMRWLNFNWPISCSLYQFLFFNFSVRNWVYRWWCHAEYDAFYPVDCRKEQSGDNLLWISWRRLLWQNNGEEGQVWWCLRQVPGGRWRPDGHLRRSRQQQREIPIALCLSRWVTGNT